jgi:regulatory protein
LVARPVLSLKGRALGCLARREHSRKELARKLAPHAESPEQLEALLDELVRLTYLSDDRFITSLVHRRGQRYGSARLKQELGGHGLDQQKVKDALSAAKSTEFERALNIWRRKFGGSDRNFNEAKSLVQFDAAARAKQIRFLAARGFSGDVIQKVLKYRLDDQE